MVQSSEGRAAVVLRASGPLDRAEAPYRKLLNRVPGDADGPATIVTSVGSGSATFGLQGVDPFDSRPGFRAGVSLDLIGIGASPAVVSAIPGPDPRRARGLGRPGSPAPSHAGWVHPRHGRPMYRAVPNILPVARSGLARRAEAA